MSNNPIEPEGFEKEGIKRYANIENGVYDRVVNVPMKDFIVKGIIFVESKVTIDVNGERTGSEITNDMLMREAEKLDADDVINVRIDKIDQHKIMDGYDKDGVFIKRKYKQLNYIYKATGLAIKYTKAIILDNLKNKVTVSINDDEKKETKEKNDNKNDLFSNTSSSLLKKNLK